MAPPTVTVLVLAKQPLSGRVKTRLTPPYLPEQAAALAAAALCDTLDAVVAATAQAAADPSTAVLLQPLLVLDGTPGTWLAAGLPWMPQVPGPLDARLGAAFDSCAGPTLLVGMDTPQLTPTLLIQAARALVGHDAVFGAAADGGWWALGLRRPVGDLIRGIPTSVPTTGQQQRSRLVAAGLLVADLPVLRDIDTAADAAAVARLAPATRFARLLSRYEADRPMVAV